MNAASLPITLENQQTWLVTGAAGFIGSHLVQNLLALGQSVIGLDNFETGHKKNIDRALQLAEKFTGSFDLIEGDICKPSICVEAVRKADHVLHQAALGSVPRSIENPIRTNDVNIGGFLNMLVAAKDAEVSSFTYAASSSTYGDSPILPKQEDVIGKPLSPYATTKLANEIYAEVFAKTYGFQCIGLRYFNVYGPRQDPEGAYAAVIPRWIDALIHQKQVLINGDGETSRDFCFVNNVVLANILSALANDSAKNNVYNVACAQQTSLNQLYRRLKELVTKRIPSAKSSQASYQDFRKGDVRHSLADISKIRTKLNYEPQVLVNEGLQETVESYFKTADRAATT